jgi:hypothetical protein
LQAPLQQRFATQDYGSGEGDPAGGNPKEQGKSQVSEDAEHPGPDMPKAAKDKMARNKQKSSGQGEQQQSSQSSSEGGEKQKKSTTASKEVGKSKGSKSDYGSKGPQPKILNENPPSEHSQGVKEHNEEMENRYERAQMGVSNKDAKNDKGEKVGKGFWSG